MPSTLPASDWVSPTLLDDAIDFQGKVGLELLTFRIGETDVGEHVAATFFESQASWFFGCHC